MHGHPGSSLISILHSCAGGQAEGGSVHNVFVGDPPGVGGGQFVGGGVQSVGIGVVGSGVGPGVGSALGAGVGEGVGSGQADGGS